jgi:multiple sugar transport system substrate-binding protein
VSPKASLGILAGLSIILGIARSDTGVGAERKKTQISFWNGWTGPDGQVALDMIREFNKDNPDVQVTMQRMPWDTYYNKLMVAETDGRGPEVFVIHAATLPRMHRAGFVSVVDDMFGTAIPAADFDDKVLKQVEFDGHYAAVPLDIHPQGLYVNTEMLKSIGYDHAPRNRAEFVDVAERLKKDGQWGFALTMWRNNFMSLIPQFGGRYMDDRGNSDLANPGNVTALSFLGELEKRKLVPPPENGLGWVGYRQRKVAMVFEGVYMLGDLKTLDGMPYAGAPIPQIGPRPGTLADSHCLCIQEGLSKAKRAAAERFIAFLSKNSIEWADAGQVPARKSVRELPEFKNMQVQYAFARQIPNAMYPPRTTALFEISLEIDLAVEKVMRGRATPQDALKVADQHAQKFIDRDRRERSVQP